MADQSGDFHFHICSCSFSLASYLNPVPFSRGPSGALVSACFLMAIRQSQDCISGFYTSEAQTPLLLRDSCLCFAPSSGRRGCHSLLDFISVKSIWGLKVSQAFHVAQHAKLEAFLSSPSKYTSCVAPDMAGSKCLKHPCDAQSLA